MRQRDHLPLRFHVMCPPFFVCQYTDTIAMIERVVVQNDVAKLYPVPFKKYAYANYAAFCIVRTSLGDRFIETFKCPNSEPICRRFRRTK